MEEIEHRIHWLAFTVHAPNEDAIRLYDILFKDKFGALEAIGHGGRGFREIYHSLFEFKFYLSPTMGNGQYWHCEIPGLACDVLGCEYFQALGDYLISNYGDAFKVTRLDYAFDHVPFTPELVEQAIREEQLRSLAKRETLEVHASPFAKKDNGEPGTYTVSFGSRTSERMIRVYNKRGFTRLEFETKDRRANLIAKQLFSANNLDTWFYTVLAHLRDYIDFAPSWWEEFANSVNRAGATVTNPKDIFMGKMFNWMDRQVAPALSVIHDVYPPEVIETMIKRGRSRRGPKYNLLLGKYD